MKISNPFPALHLREWDDTKHTIHLLLQIVGKIRLALFPKKNHWWHVPFYLSVRGLTTGPIPYQHGLLEMHFDFIDHTFHMDTSLGDRTSIPLGGHSVAEFYERVFAELNALHIDVKIIPKPFDIPTVDVTHFAECHDFDAYNKQHIETMWQILVTLDGVFQEFRGHFSGKSTPVHLFWHHFDLALTRFSGKPAPAREGISQIEREAYSHEVISFGFWFGDQNLTEPAFYAYGFPVPEGAKQETLLPKPAFWDENGTATLKYHDINESDDPRRAILDFLESSYKGVARHMDWDTDAFKLEDES